MTAEMKTEPGLPALVEAYRDFEPPANFKQVVETLLAYVPPKYLAGLKTIILTNSSGLSRDRRRQKTWSRNRKVRLSECGGFYSQATRSSPATVSLYVDNIVRDLPRWMSRPPVLRYMVPSDVLYHEIGHHIHTVHKPIHEQREDVAEEWTPTSSGAISFASIIGICYLFSIRLRCYSDSRKEPRGSCNDR
jgi:hypothetical protein